LICIFRCAATPIPKRWRQLHEHQRMKLFGLTITLLLFGTLLTFGQVETVSKLDLKIFQRDSYAAGQPIFVTLTISNPTDSTQKIEFTETHKYHRTLPFPTCISASIKDDKGKNKCSYSSQYFFWSTLFTKEDFQYVDIKPGDKLSRDLKVNEIVSGCDCFQDHGLKSGTYYISLYIHGRQTNELKITVK
jgi:hypothetical protein